MIEYLTLEDVLELCDDLGVVVRDPGLLESAVARPRTTVFGEDAYPSIELKAAALMQSSAKSHPLIDGNERLAWAATVLFLRLNDHDSSLTPRQATDFTITVARSDVQIGWIATEMGAVPGWGG